MKAGNFMFENLNENQKLAVLHIEDSLKLGINPICALSMGSGKTMVACKIIHNTMTINKNYRILIVIKASNFKDPWMTELQKTGCIIEKQENSENYIKAKKIKNKENIIKKYDKFIYLHGIERYIFYKINSNEYLLPGNNIFITSYDTLRIDIEENRYNLTDSFDLIIFDELHKIINTTNHIKNLTALSKLKAFNKVALSGTPIQNDVPEMGLMYIFLNDQEKLNHYLLLSKQIKNILNDEEIEDINDLTELEGVKSSIININKDKNILLQKGMDDCINKKAIFIHNKKKLIL